MWDTTALYWRGDDAGGIDAAVEGLGVVVNGSSIFH
jgi:hypothetical protein